MPRHLTLAGVLALSLVAPPPVTGRDGQAPPDPTATPSPGRTKLERLAEPWPDEETLQKRRRAAESLPLFSTSEPLAFTLAADFRAVNRDRQVDSSKRFPAVLTISGGGGQPVAIPVQLGTRGNLRLNRRTCAFVPLRVDFPKQEAKGTVFERQGSLKLVTHCQNDDDHDQRVLGEALAYRIANTLTPASFRVRLARATYLEASSGKTVATRWAMFIEDADDVARRMLGRIAPIEKKVFSDIHLRSLLRLSVFQVMIGNTDYSIHALHNIRLVMDRQAALHPIAYDFDVSGLVDPPYGAPDPRMELASIRERRYRGPCLGLAALEPTLDEFRARKDEILALYHAGPRMAPREIEKARRYLLDFFEILSSPRRSKTLFLDRCRPVHGM
jgi:hypothetical protein